MLKTVAQPATNHPAALAGRPLYTHRHGHAALHRSLHACGAVVR